MNSETKQLWPDGYLPRVLAAAAAPVKTQEDKHWLVLWSFFKNRHPVWRRGKARTAANLPDLSTAGKMKYMVRVQIRKLRRGK